ncbi:alpha-1,2-fucosyltransferase [Methylophaga sp.]|uniref:alpha-1,2-fucosyltransferase n=1 Tax=Methylophaga sp. TaxID=2024840 RepID=UPI003A90A72C
MILYISDGRLGNQLFQYVFLNTIAKENEKIIAINMWKFYDDFDINNPNFIPVIFGKYGLYLVRKVLKPFFLYVLVPLKLIVYVRQNRSETSALPTFNKTKGFLPITLVESNFFQSEDFFNSEKVDFTIKNKYIQQAEGFLQRIPKQYTKVFIHVRRGDYLSETYLGEQGINLPMSYFKNAMLEIDKEIKNPYYVFLSDDPEFVEWSFSNVKNKIISNNDMVTDLAIMSECSYGIVSNSSFSWWGAYLMKNRIKVIFPKFWYGWKAKVESHIGIQPSWSTIIDVK